MRKKLLIIFAVLLMGCIPFIVKHCEKEKEINNIRNTRFDNFVKKNFPMLKYSSLGIIELKAYELSIFKTYYNSYNFYESLNHIKQIIENDNWYHNHMSKYFMKANEAVANGVHFLPEVKDKDKVIVFNQYMNICYLLNDLSNKYTPFDVSDNTEAINYENNVDSLCKDLCIKISEFESSNSDLLE